jgi:(p)ppGpp synthase/HD superfamily hydrolase
MRTRLERQAARFAQRAHKGQRDKSGKPFVGHPARVALALREHGEVAYAAGFLHDVVEDTIVELDTLAAAGFPTAVIEAVDLVTRTSDQTYWAYIDRIVASGNKTAMLVKLADIADNSRPERNSSILDAGERGRLTKMVQTRYVKAQALVTAALEGAS